MRSATVRPSGGVEDAASKPLPHGAVFLVRRRRRRDSQRLESVVLAGADAAVDVGRNDDHVPRFDVVVGVALADESAAGLDADRHVAARRVDRNELSGLEVAERDLLPIALEDGARGESIVVVRPFGIEVGRWHR